MGHLSIKKQNKTVFLGTTLLSLFSTPKQAPLKHLFFQDAFKHSEYIYSILAFSKLTKFIKLLPFFTLPIWILELQYYYKVLRLVSGTQWVPSLH